jgi:hypothetical protein
VRSKWLEWTPESGFVGFEGSSSRDSAITSAPNETPTRARAASNEELIPQSSVDVPTEPTEPTPMGNRGGRWVEPPYFWGADRDGKPRDYYGWRAHTALDAMCAIPAPAGVIVWLGDHAPFLYEMLTSILPNKISRAWDAHAAHEAFSALCVELVDTYRCGVELYVATMGSLQREHE